MSYFNVFGWQLVFVLGVVLGNARFHERTWCLLFDHRAALTCAFVRRQLLFGVVVIRHISFTPGSGKTRIVKGITQCGPETLAYLRRRRAAVLCRDAIVMRFPTSILAATSVTFCGFLLLILFAAIGRNRGLETPVHSGYR
jgi:hypothetical protein